MLLPILMDDTKIIFDHNLGVRLISILSANFAGEGIEIEVLERGLKVETSRQI